MARSELGDGPVEVPLADIAPRTHRVRVYVDVYGESCHLSPVGWLVGWIWQGRRPTRLTFGGRWVGVSEYRQIDEDRTLLDKDVIRLQNQSWRLGFGVPSRWTPLAD